MKVFISGSKSLCEISSDQKLPKTVRTYLDRVMSGNDEVLIGDCRGADTLVQEYLSAKKYDSVIVYESGNNGTARNNLGHWEEKHIPSKGRTAYAHRMEKDLHMADDCDQGVAVWDGESKGTFINMLCLCALGKPCKLYLFREERWIDLNSPEDLRAFTGPEGIFTADEEREVLGRCGFSDEMKEYLVSKEAISPYALINVICRAPITLDEKSNLLKCMAGKRNLKLEAFASAEGNAGQGKDYESIKQDIRELADFRGEESIWTILYDRLCVLLDAKRELYSSEDDEIHDKSLILFSEWYDIDEIRLKSSVAGLFTSVGAIEKYIENEEYDVEPDNDTVDWYYRVEAWDTGDTGWEKPRYDYYFYRGELCWFEKLVPEKQKHGNTYYMLKDPEFAAGRLDLDFSTPYKPGDIVLIDCSPFGPPFHAMILEARNQWDCCYPNIVFQYPAKDEWSLTPLKHKRLYKDISWHTYCPMLSPLYRLRKVGEDELTEDDNKLLSLSRMISGSEEKAGRVWKNWNDETGKGISWEKVLEVFEQVESNGDLILHVENDINYKIVQNNSGIRVNVCLEEEQLPVLNSSIKPIRPDYPIDGSVDEQAFADYQCFITDTKFELEDLGLAIKYPNDGDQSPAFREYTLIDLEQNEVHIMKYMISLSIYDHHTDTFKDTDKLIRDHYRRFQEGSSFEQDHRVKWRLRQIIVNGELFNDYDDAVVYIRMKAEEWSNISISR